MVLLLTGGLTASDPPTSVLAAVIWLGSVIVGGLLFAIRSLYKDLGAERTARTVLAKDFSDYQADQLRESLKVTIDATSRMAEAERAVEAATVMLHQIAGRQLTAETMVELNYNLRALRELRERGA